MHFKFEFGKSQLNFFKNSTKEYGGSLLTKRAARSIGRPVSTRDSMHFVMRSTYATGKWSFLRHKTAIRAILEKFADRYGVQLKSMANVGNHLHLHLQLSNRHTYRPFIRAISAAIMMSVTNSSRWKKWPHDKKFWDRRPFSRVTVGFKALLNLKDYIAINRMEAFGYDRNQARFLVAWNRTAKSNSS